MLPRADLCVLPEMREWRLRCRSYRRNIGVRRSLSVIGGIGAAQPRETIDAANKSILACLTLYVGVGVADHASFFARSSPRRTRLQATVAALYLCHGAATRSGIVSNGRRSVSGQGRRLRGAAILLCRYERLSLAHSDRPADRRKQSGSSTLSPRYTEEIGKKKELASVYRRQLEGYQMQSRGGEMRDEISVQRI